MLTIFTIPKAFLGHNGLIQRNAIQSWMQLHPDCQIILYGDEEGVKEYAEAYGLVNVPDIQKNEYGTPFLDYIFEHAKSHAKHNIICYINADIILPHDFIVAIQKITLDSYLLVGQRVDLDIKSLIPFENINWEVQLQREIHAHGTFLGVWGIDFFVFPKTSPIRLLPFLVGRKGWDNWLIYHAQKLGIPVIDVTPMVMVIHQNHNYDHVPMRCGEKWSGPESDYNMDLMGNSIAKRSRIYLWSINDANMTLTPSGLVKRPSDLRGMELLLLLNLPQKFHSPIGLLHLIIESIRTFQERHG